MHHPRPASPARLRKRHPLDLPARARLDRIGHHVKGFRRDEGEKLAPVGPAVAVDIAEIFDESPAVGQGVEMEASAAVGADGRGGAGERQEAPDALRDRPEGRERIRALPSRGCPDRWWRGLSRPRYPPRRCRAAGAVAGQVAGGGLQEGKAVPHAGQEVALGVSGTVSAKPAPVCSGIARLRESVRTSGAGKVTGFEKIRRSRAAGGGLPVGAADRNAGRTVSGALMPLQRMVSVMVAGRTPYVPCKPA